MTNPLRRNGHRTTEQPACPPTSIWCCGPTQKPDLRDVVCCGYHANDSHTGAPWDHTKIRVFPGGRKSDLSMLLTPRSRVPWGTKKWEVMLLCLLFFVDKQHTTSVLFFADTHTTLALKKSPAQSQHVLGANVQQCPAAGRPQRRCFISTDRWL